ncbi:ATP-binding protein [Bacillus paramycoides]|uniref:ATP-binding protein n=1 Tax=Bacillus paramycoides TaxID=2026194 RepID=UPI002E1D0123|nr:ATP-binding protein [Bacillus paramycoides]MED1557551.1 ATP-binding protein [Bacillus paramycoides]
MQKLGKKVATLTNTISDFKQWEKNYMVSPNRCKNVFLVGEEKIKDVCNKKMLIDKHTNEEFCPHCKMIEQEDQRLAEETLVIKQTRKVVHLFDAFADNSLINDKLKKATFDNYNPTNENLARAKGEMQRFAETFDPKNPESKVITGLYGIGKSHLCVAVTKVLMKKGYSALFIQMNKLFTKIKSTWNRNSELTEDKLMELLATVDVLVIDDLGAEFTERDKEGITWKQTKTNEIIDSRVGKSTLYTSNFTTSELATMYGEREFSRMMENATKLEMAGDNYRLRNFKKGEE